MDILNLSNVSRLNGFSLRKYPTISHVRRYSCRTISNEILNFGLSDIRYDSEYPSENAQMSLLFLNVFLAIIVSFFRLTVRYYYYEYYIITA